MYQFILLFGKWQFSHTSNVHTISLLTLLEKNCKNCTAKIGRVKKEDCGFLMVSYFKDNILPTL
jgi:hypothetical protein